MNIIVTGGAGFIGSAIAKKLIKLENKVYILDNLSTGLEENIPKKSEFINFDISKESEYEKINNLKNIDAVLHLAAQSSGEISFEDPIYDMEVNIKGTLLLLEWCRKNNVNRFVEASSIMVYGEQNNMPLKETMKCYPKSFYAVGKLATENYLKLYSEKYGINYTVFRMGNIYGPGQNLDNLKQGMVSIYLAYLLKNKPMIVKGDLDRFRDFMYIDDVVNNWVESINNKNTFKEVFNLGIGYPVTVEELINNMFEILNLDKNNYPVKICANTPGDVKGNYCDTKKLDNVLGLKEKLPLKIGLKKMIEYYKGNKNE